MLIAFISDIHGNYIAFDLLLQRLKKGNISKIFFLGDAVGYFPDGNLVVQELNERKIECILGNHDAMVVGHLKIDDASDKIYLIQKQKQVLSPQSYKILSAWLPYKLETIESYRVLLVHGSPFNPLLGYIYPDSPLDILSELNFDIIVMGHTHRPFLMYKNNKHLINTGSVGLPRDFGDKSSYVLWDTDKNSVSIERITLPVEDIFRKYSSIHEHVQNVMKRNNNLL